MSAAAASASFVVRGTYDLTVIGGGIVGLAVARQALLRHPKLRVCVLEKEKELASHQSKRNSGVVHCGIYYKKGTLKSKFCISGAKKIEEFCNLKGLPYKKCGKLIVATNVEELNDLHKLHANAIANGIEGIELISKERVKEIQPGCSGAIEALWSPNTAIVDWQKVALSYAEDFKQLGGEIYTDFVVHRFISQRDGKNKSVNLENAKQGGDVVKSNAVVSCAGVYSDFMARQTLNNEHPKVVPFKGNYFLLSDRFAHTIKTNIYPVPNPKLPFLGVHVTPRVDGSVLIGPTSLLTLGYERYSPDESINLLHLYHIIIRSGLRKLLWNQDNIFAGIQELSRFLSKKRVAKDVQAFIPQVEASDLIDTSFCGIRAQVVTKTGQLVDDFLFESGFLEEFDRVLHVRNCPSPAATSSLAIAERVVNILEERFI